MSVPVPPGAVRWIVVLTGVGSLMAALDTLVVATALTTIRTDLDATVQAAGMDGQLLQPGLRGAADHRGRAG